MARPLYLAEAASGGGNDGNTIERPPDRICGGPPRRSRRQASRSASISQAA